MKISEFRIFWALLITSQLFAEGLVSNFTFAVHPGLNPGQLWVLGRGDVSNGLTRVYLNQSGRSIQVVSFETVLFEEDLYGVQDEIFTSVTGEHRRSLLLRDSNVLFTQAFVPDANQSGILPQGFARVQGSESAVFDVAPSGLGATAAIDWPTPLQVSVADAQFDRDRHLWVVRGPWGLSRSSQRPSQWNDAMAISATTKSYLLNPKTQVWDTLSEGDVVDTTKTLSLWSLSLDSATGRFWVGTEKGLWQGHQDSSKIRRIRLGKYDTLRITGIWRSPLGRIFVENSKRSTVKTSSGSTSTKTISSLWISENDGASFSEAKLPYDSLDLSISSAAFVGDESWLAVQGIENNWTGLLRFKGSNPLQWADSLRMPDREDASPWVWSLEAGVIDRDALATGVTTFPLQSSMGIAVSTYGAGISVSADSGRTWKPILNQTPVKGGLKEVRMVPSVMRYGGGSFINYRLDQDSKVTIEVFGYEMRKVRTIVRNAARLADPIRSSNPKTDYWDGRDDAGNPATVGLYYVRVKDQKGRESWGKVMWLGAPR